MENQVKNQELYIYDQYIAYLRSIKHDPQEKLEKHRITPRHKNGTYTESNVVLCTFKQHTLAHFYRYLSFKQKGDLIGYTFMCNQTDEGRLLMASYAGQIGGKVTNKKNKVNKAFFYSVEWQKEFGDKNTGKRNLESGSLAKLNDRITKQTPELRKKAGKLGGKAVIKKHRLNKTGMFDQENRIQRKGNLVRWGIGIRGVRVPYEKLSSDFIDYYIEYGNPFIIKL
jgi:hypothetical protein